MSYLIDSVIKNYYVPPVIFSCKQGHDGRIIRVCIDGKQRLTAIRRFVNNQIPHLDPYEERPTKKFFSVAGDVAGKCGLTTEEQETFQHKDVICVEYYNLTSDQEHEIFSRVQLGVSLTTGEKLQAIPSPMSSLVGYIVENFPLLKSVVDSRRARPFQMIAQALHIMYYEQDKLSSSAVKIEKFLKNPCDVDVELRQRGISTFEIYSSLIQNNPEIFHNPARM
ncbi:hypothetical protein K7432_005525, partial [Basidiobolus ranarum]